MAERSKRERSREAARDAVAQCWALFSVNVSLARSLA